MSDYLTHMYKGKPYVKSDVRKCPLLDDCYIFDICDGCKFITSRTILPNTEIGYNLFDVMSRNNISNVLCHITSYTDVPLFVKTELGTAIAISPLTNSCSLGMLIFADFGTDDMYRYAKINQYRICATDEVSRGRRSRVGKQYIKTADKCELLFDRLNSAFSGISNNPFVYGDITHIIEQRLYALSYYAGCPISIVCNTPLLSVGDFDMSYFTSVMLICMIISRDLCQKNGITVVLDSDEKEVTVKIAIGVATRELLDIYSFRRMCDISRRRNIDLDYYFDDYLTYVKFAPYEFDISIYGVKSPAFDENDDEIVPEEAMGFE